MRVLNSSIEFMVIGSRPCQFFLRFRMPSTLEIPFKTSLTRSDRSTGAWSPVIMCSCLIPARYELMVVHLRPRTLASQSINVRIWDSVRGRFMLVFVSRLHLPSIISAVLYVLHVFFVTARLLQLATDLAISGCRFKPFKLCIVHLPVGPYFVDPGKAVGWKPAWNRIEVS